LQFVEVDEVRSVGEGPADFARSGQAPEVGAEEQSYGFEPITFYPDGSSDTSEVVFSARESEEERQVAVQIIGTTGTVRRRAIEIVGLDPGKSGPTSGARPSGGGAGEK